MSPSSHRLLDFLGAPLATWNSKPAGLLELLRAIQSKFGYLPAEVLDELEREGPFKPAHIKATVRFFDEFRTEPARGKTVGVCHGTACHTAGAAQVLAALGSSLPATTEIVRTGCLGCCTLAPVVQVDGRVLGHALPTTIAAQVTGEPIAVMSEGGPGLAPGSEQVRIRVGIGSCCQAKGADAVLDEVARWAARWPDSVAVEGVGCVAACSATPLLEVALGDGPWRAYTQVTPEAVGRLLAEAVPQSLPSKALRALAATVARIHAPGGQEPSQRPTSVAMQDFLAGQCRLATEGMGEVVPTDLEGALKRGAFAAMTWARNHPQETVDVVTQSGLRGRGGAGFATGQKWLAALGSPGPRVVIANGDEGDPGAFMDRMLLESFPFRILEGLAIAAAAVGASQAILFVRAEYALACERCQAALAACRDAGIFGPDLSVTLVKGASAYVCGEETALISVLENRGPFPRARPPYPAQSGYLGRPTVVNNIETLALLPWIVREGANAFRRHGTEASPGTKVFALAGKVRRGGLVEVPLGTTLHHIVEVIGGGARPGRTLKAVQIGGPSGGCVPASRFDLPVTFESLKELGAIMGSGGLVVLDDSDCMVDLARYFVAFSAAQACGGCRPGREGVAALLEGLDQLCQGHGDRALVASLERISHDLARDARCGLCRAAPRPFLSSLAAFPEEYEAHLGGQCAQARCSALVHYVIEDSCTGCTRCVQVCPTRAITGDALACHAVVDATCIRCGACLDACPFGAIRVIPDPG